MKKYILLAVALVLAAGAYAQTAAGKINVQAKEAIQRGDSVYIGMDIMLEGMSMNSSRSMTLTPMLEASGRSMELPSVVINGSTRQRLFKRAMSLHKDAAKGYYAVVRSRNRRDKAGESYVRTVPYHLAVPYEAWMDSARVLMVQELCGCGGYEQQVSVEPLVNRIDHEVVAPPVVRDTVYVATPAPTPPLVKIHADTYSANLRFLVGKSNIDPQLGNNMDELIRIKEFITKMSNNQDIAITSVSVQGMASIEGTEALNSRLSDARAESLLLYLTGQFEWMNGHCEVLRGGEDWEMLNEETENNALLRPYRAQLRRILDMSRTPDAKEALIRQIDGGQAYKLLLQNVFPRMRRVNCIVNYVVKTEEQQ
ncbi:MAG: DUF3868 domain-containing protein [Prevotellaceae bacterium]|jgi:hypothetical protein|nr:DUF3868 domain-containing protein [Prevotellaceae bacterium]